MTMLRQDIECLLNSIVKMVTWEIKKKCQNLDTDMESNTGLMVPIMRDSGISIKQRVQVLFGMLKEMFIEVISKMIWLMVTENTLISMEVNIEANSKMTFKKATEKKNGSTVPNMSVLTKTV